MVFAWLLALALFVGMVLLLLAGRRIGLRNRAADPEGYDTGLGPLDGAIFGLLGLLLAFTFSGAAERLEHRRDLIVEESNAIGTAYLRLDLLSSPARENLQEKLRVYTDTRLAAYAKMPDIEAAQAGIARAGEIGLEIWKEATAAARAEGYQPATILLLPALNEMLDITNSRTMATRSHPPTIIYAMLFLIALASSLLAGYGIAGKSRSWIHMIGFSLTMAVAFYVILDIEYPRLGLIRVDSFDQALIDVRASMK